MIDTQNYVKELITKVDSKRINDTIAGPHPDLPKFQAWYRGYNEWHLQKQVVGGEIKNKRIAASGLGRLGASEWASMFLNEGTKITVPDEKGNDKLQEILKENHVISNLNSFGEKYFGLGYGSSCAMPSNIDFFKNEEEETAEVVANKENKVKIYFLDALRTYPITIEDGNVTEAAIVRYATNKAIFQVHLLNEQGNYVIGEMTGKVVEDSITLNPNTFKMWDTKSPVKLFQAWYPAKVDNEHINNQIGTSILTHDAIGWIKAFDIAFDKFITEYKNGGKRRYVSAELTYINEDGESAAVPLSDEDVYLPPNKMGDSPNMVQEHSSEIRAEAFIRGMQFYINMFGRAIGLGEDAFPIDSSGRPVQTATAAILKKNGGFRNVQRNENLAEGNLIDLCMAIKSVYNTCVEPDGLKYERSDVQIVFEDNIIEDVEAKKQADMQEVSASVMAPWEYRGKYYDETEDDAKKFLQENGLMVNLYLPALQSGALSPDLFVNLVFGDSVENRDELVAYITDKMAAGQMNETPFNMDGQDEAQPKEKGQDQEEGEEDDEE